MPAFLQEPFNLVKRKGSKGFLFFYYVYTVVSLLFVDILFKYINYGILFDPDVIHILFIDLILGSFIMVLLVVFPIAIRKYVLTAAVFFFVIIAFMYSLIGFEGLIAENIYSSTLFNEVMNRVSERFNWVQLLFFLPLLVLFVPYRVQYSKVKYVSIVGLLLISSVVGTLYLNSVRYNNVLEPTNNLEKIIYNDEGRLLFNRLGVNIAFLRTTLNEAEYNIESNENLLGQTDAYLEEQAQNWNEYRGMFQFKNLVIVEVEGLDYLAIQPEVMPTLISMMQEGLTFTNYYHEKTQSENFEMFTGIYADTTSLNSMAEFSLNSYPHALGNQFLNMNYETSYLSNDRLRYEYETNFIARAGFFNINDSYDYSNTTLTDYELVKASFSDVTENYFYAHYKLNGLSELQVESSKYGISYDSITASDEVKKYYSYANEIDMALDYIITSLASTNRLGNTVIMVVSGGRPMYINEETIRANVDGRGEFAINRLPMMIWDGYEEGVISEHMGSVNITPTLANMFRFRGTPLYVADDVFASGNNVVTFENQSWVSNAGYYDALHQKFYISDPIFNTEFLDEYIKNVNTNLYVNRTYSRIILDKNYFIQVKV